MQFVESTAEEALRALRDLRSGASHTFDGATLNENEASGADRSATPTAKRFGVIVGEAERAYWDAILDFNEGNFGLAAPPQRAGAEGRLLVPRVGKDTGLRRIDLNADCGEGFDDVSLMKYVTSVNIACGAHAGDVQSIAETVALAVEHGLGIGAHPSFADRENFGRTPLDTPPDELLDEILWQVGALDALCRRHGSRVRYIKPHGALYHVTMEGGEQGKAVLEAARSLHLPLLLMPQSPWATFGEGFCERAYDGDHKLRPRDQPGAIIHDPEEAAAQALTLAANPSLHTICVHGDSKHAVTVARSVRSALDGAGFTVAPFLSDC